MGQSGGFKKVLESGKEGAEQGGAYGLVQGLQRGFEGSAKPEPPRMAGEAMPTSGSSMPSYRTDRTGISSNRSRIVTSGREYRKLGKFQ